MYYIKKILVLGMTVLALGNSWAIAAMSISQFEEVRKTGGLAEAILEIRDPDAELVNYLVQYVNHDFMVRDLIKLSKDKLRSEYEDLRSPETSQANHFTASFFTSLVLRTRNVFSVADVQTKGDFRAWNNLGSDLYVARSRDGDAPTVWLKNFLDPTLAENKQKASLLNRLYFQAILIANDNDSSADRASVYQTILSKLPDSAPDQIDLPAAKPAAKVAKKLSKAAAVYIPLQQMSPPPAKSRPEQPYDAWASRFRKEFLETLKLKKVDTFEGPRKKLFETILENRFRDMDTFAGSADPQNNLRTEQDQVERQKAERDIIEYLTLPEKEFEKAESREFIWKGKQAVLTSLMLEDGKPSWNKIYGKRHFTPVQVIKAAFNNYRGKFALSEARYENEKRLWFIDEVKTENGEPVYPKKYIRISFIHNETMPNKIQIISAYFRYRTLSEADKRARDRATVDLFEPSIQPPRYHPG